MVQQVEGYVGTEPVHVASLVSTFDDAEGEWKFVKKKSRKRKTEVQALPSETPPLSPQDSHQTDREMTDSEHKGTAHRDAHHIFLEAVLYDTPVPSPRTEQLEDQEKKAAYVTRLEAMINMANNPEMTELHKSLSAELARVTKTVKITAEQCEAGKDISLDCS